MGSLPRRISASRGAAVLVGLPAWIMAGLYQLGQAMKKMEEARDDEGRD